MTEGFPLNDWIGTQVASDTWVSYADKMFQSMLRMKVQKCHANIDLQFFSVYLKVRQALAFVRAHRLAQKIFNEQFISTDQTSTQEKVISESNEQIRLAESELSRLDRLEVDSITSHFACHVLLNISMQYVEMLSMKDLIPEQEASGLLADLDECVGRLMDCRKLACIRTGKSSFFPDSSIEGTASDLDSPLLRG